VNNFDVTIFLCQFINSVALYIYGAMWLALENPGQTHECLSRVVLNWLWWKSARLCCPQSY